MIYCPAKAAAVVDLAHDQADSFVAAFKARPDNEELWSALTEVLPVGYRRLWRCR
jgi:hypothetical protein